MLAVVLLFIFSCTTLADTLYVSPTGGHSWPFSSWADAATNIQDAVDAALDGDVVLVTNGIYQLAESVAVSNAVAVRSCAGADDTVLTGAQCFSLFHSHALVEGFTMRDGDWVERGGGVYCQNGAMVSSCVISNCQARYGGAVYGGTVSNCSIFCNLAFNGGGTYESTVYASGTS